MVFPPVFMLNIKLAHFYTANVWKKRLPENDLQDVQVNDILFIVSTIVERK
jgi:hypothetical protein